MQATETFFRDKPVSTEERHLPAEIYNQARLLLDYADKPHVFIPIRSIQYLSVMDNSEIIFVDRYGQRQIEFAWQKFRPQVRSSLTEPVPFTLACYQDKAHETMKRALWEFAKAVKVLSGRQQRSTRRLNQTSKQENVISFPAPKT